MLVLYYRSPSHAILIGVSGESHARIAIETNGQTLYGNGGGSKDKASMGGWHTGVRRHISNFTQWAPGSVAPGVSIDLQGIYLHFV